MKGTAAILCLLLLAGCCTTRRLATSVERQDSVRLSSHVEIRERWVPRPVALHIPAQRVSALVPDSSHLETEYAVSDARITEDGQLHHELWNKARDTVGCVPVRDTEIIRIDTVKVVRFETKTVAVPAELSRWQKLWITLGKIFGGVLVSAVVFAGYKLLRLIR